MLWLKMLFWYVLERLVRIPTSILMWLHEILMDKVIRSLDDLGESAWPDGSGRPIRELVDNT